MTKKILITGINGFVGTNLAKYLRRSGEYELYGLIRSDANVEPLREYVKEFFHYDSLKFMQSAGFDAIVHCAGKAHDVKNTSESKAYDQVNYELTKAVFDQFYSSGAQKFIFLSSVKAVADKVDGTLTEACTPDPKTPYGISKLKAENYLRQFFHNKEKQTYILRPCMIYGPGNKGNLNLLYKLVNSGAPVPLGRFQNERSFLSVENLAFVVQRLLESAAPSDVFNVADEGCISTVDLIRLIGKATGKKTWIINLPERWMKALASAGDRLPLPLNSERLEKLTENYRVSSEKIRKTLNCDFPVGLRNGLISAIRSFNEK